MIGMESAATERIAMARELAEARRAQFRRSRAEPRPHAYRPGPAIRSARPRIRSASRA